MNWILVCVFNLLLINSCLTTNIDRGSFRNGANAFNEEFVYPIFDIAELEEILQMAKTPRTADFVKNHIFPVKYQNYTFHYYVTWNQRIAMYSNSILIPDLNFYMDLLTHFGKNMKSIGIDCLERNINDAELAALNECISEHCSNSTTSINFGFIRKNTFKNFTKIFPNVKSLRIDVRSNQIGSVLSIHELFPNVETIQIIYEEPAVDNQNNETTFIESEFPAMEQLKDLSIWDKEKNKATSAVIKKQLADLFRKNPQIQKLRYLSYSKNILDDFIHEINEYLPSLEHLNIYAIDQEIQPVRFENVKHFEIETWTYPFPADKVSFSHLKVLSMYYTPKDRDTWTTFFQKHQSLRKLHCKIELQDDGLAETLAELQNILEIDIVTSHPFNIDFVAEIIESHGNLVKFDYRSAPRDAAHNLDMDGFLEKYGNEWNINYGVSTGFVPRKFIELKRKN